MDVYTLNEAAEFVELFESVLDQYDITVPSPEDDEREEGNDARLYGSVFWDLVDKVQEKIIDIVQRVDEGAEVIADVFEDPITEVSEVVDEEDSGETDQGTGREEET